MVDVQVEKGRGPSVAAVVLAAGRSTRMGAFKPLMPFGGGTVVSHVVGCLVAARIAPVIVVVGHDASQLTPEVEALGAVAVFNSDFAGGMMTSVRAGVAALPEEVTAAFVLPVDIPMIRSQTLLRLAAAATRSSIVRPTFRGRIVHPPLIGSDFFADILGVSPGETLRQFLADRQDATIELPVIDSGTQRDMDCTAEYWRLVDDFATNKHPDESECEAMLEMAGTPEPTRRHARAVTRLALDIAAKLRFQGTPLDVDLVRAGALLHDIAKGETDHAAVGARYVADFGFPDAARIVAGHMEMAFAPGDPIDERVVVVLADKLTSGERQVTLEERFAPAFVRFANEPDALRGARRKYASVAMILAAVEAKIGPVRPEG